FISAAASGLERALARVDVQVRQRIPQKLLGVAQPVVPALIIAGLVCSYLPRMLAPVNEGMGGYRTAGLWLRDHITPGSKVVDVTGWTLYYGRLDGYTFGTLIQAPGDPAARWVVAREAHLRGPWPYCAQLRSLVGDATPAATFHGNNRRHPTKVFIF